MAGKQDKRTRKKKVKKERKKEWNEKKWNKESSGNNCKFTCIGWEWGVEGKGRMMDKRGKQMGRMRWKRNRRKKREGENVQHLSKIILKSLVLSILLFIFSRTLTIPGKKNLNTSIIQNTYTQKSGIFYVKCKLTMRVVVQFRGCLQSMPGPCKGGGLCLHPSTQNHGVWNALFPSTELLPFRESMNFTADEYNSKFLPVSAERQL